MSRNSALEPLHPVFREKAGSLLQECTKADLPFRLFEGFRSPERQRELYQQGRTMPGAIVTRANAWQSYHQYGVAADFVLFINGRWSWADNGEFKNHWKKLHQLAAKVELEPLSWELPHLQMKGQPLAALMAGHYPPGGDSDWADNLRQAIRNWQGPPPAPPMPPLISERPAISTDNLPLVEEPVPITSRQHAMVNARSGLRLRAGPGTDFDVTGNLHAGQRLWLLQSKGDWVQVDLAGDGLADGYCHSAFLQLLS
ncbi:M15 family metallopeptidase [Arsukibacterium ikkense]|uniref:M15 family metallopeptidase n=1 Tax=Arsukibacterium ikkense TaxID=336831 RepID=UPI00069C8B77|nr:M15 family metallopeptidase [Arsukibacterium ikkense]